MKQLTEIAATYMLRKEYYIITAYDVRKKIRESLNISLCREIKRVMLKKSNFEIELYGLTEDDYINETV